MFCKDRRQQIIRAIERLSVNRGIHEITLDEVAQAAHIGKGTIYNYFKDKNDLFFQSAAFGFDELCELVKRKFCDNRSFSEKLMDISRAIGRFFEKHRQLLGQNETSRVCCHQFKQQWALKRKKLVAAVSEILSQGVSSNAIRADISTDMLARYLLSMLRTQAKDLRNSSKTVNGYELLVALFMQVPVELTKNVQLKLRQVT